MNSYSGFREDYWIYEHLPLPHKGTFIEVGAYDGIASSNTYAFEQEGWVGFCIEPDSDVAAICQKNRRAITIRGAIGVGPTMQPFHVNEADKGTSGLRRPPTGRTTDVFVFPLWPLLNLWRPQPLDLLSIDTEGSELEVWDTIGNHRPTIVIMEFWTQPNPPNPQPLIDRMTSDGYREVHRTTANLIFHHV